MVAAERGLLKVAKGQVVKHSLKGVLISTIGKVGDGGSRYLIKVNQKLMVWDDEEEKLLFDIRI